MYDKLFENMLRFRKVLIAGDTLRYMRNKTKVTSSKELRNVLQGEIYY